jgi:hypothetical protein
MAIMGKYCKAYPVSRLRAYPGWTEKSENLRPEEADGEDRAAHNGGSAVPRQLGDDDYLFVQENLIVTDGIYIDEHVIFDAITPAWEAFCTNDLQFEIPDFEAESMSAAQ